MGQGKLKVKICGVCEHSFKMYKWRWIQKYDADCACCPKCKTPVIEYGGEGK